MNSFVKKKKKKTLLFGLKKKGGVYLTSSGNLNYIFYFILNKILFVNLTKETIIIN
jgi:hypothetical protein